MNSAMEFHDSGFEEIRRVGTAVELILQAYVFRSEGVPAVDESTGWTQTAILRFSDGFYEGTLPEKGEWISHGELVLGGNPFNELLPMPFANSVKTELKLDFNDGNHVRIFGSSFKAELTGETKFVEDIPWTKAK